MVRVRFRFKAPPQVGYDPTSDFLRVASGHDPTLTIRPKTRRRTAALTRASGPPKRARTNREQHLRKRLRSRWQAILRNAVYDTQNLQELFDAVDQQSPLDWEITRDGRIMSKGTDAVKARVSKIIQELKPLKAADGSISREHLAQAYDEPQLSAELENLKRCTGLLDRTGVIFYNSDWLGHNYAVSSVCWLERCELHVVLVQAHWRRRLVLPWRRRRAIVRCLSDESSSVIESLVSDRHLTDHVYVSGTELHATRLVDLAGLVRERGAATARSKVLRRICACCGRQNAVVRERAFPVCSCGEPHYCSVACQKAHWQTHHAKSCGREKYHREGGNRCVLRVAFRIDGSLVDPVDVMHEELPKAQFENYREAAEVAKEMAMEALLSGGGIDSLDSKIEETFKSQGLI